MALKAVLAVEAHGVEPCEVPHARHVPLTVIYKVGARPHTPLQVRDEPLIPQRSARGEALFYTLDHKSLQAHLQERALFIRRKIDALTRAQRVPAMARAQCFPGAIHDPELIQVVDAGKRIGRFTAFPAGLG